MQTPGGLPRWIEVGVASAAGIACAPVMALAAALVRLSSPGPMLFRQTRVGKDGLPFQLLKFRSMRTDAKGLQVTADGDPRITPIGALLRKSKVDELPGLWNVVRGDMSLVGPRPEVPCYVNFSDPSWKEVLQVRPGLTDPVTIRLRNEQSLVAAVQWDRDSFYRYTLLPYKLHGYREYLGRRTWWTDIQVLFSTFWAVLNPNSAPVPDLSEIRRVSTERAASNIGKPSLS
jgi:lipopolysaccharide/colanic/teichoic acid biosynthesis glycosyltransferase